MRFSFDSTAPVRTVSEGSSSKLFIKACELANCKPTLRQWKKWSAGRGLARSFKNEADEALKPAEQAE